MENDIDYLSNPEKCKGCKIPSNLQLPSCCFQLHNSVNLKTNSSGNLAIFCNPYFLGNKTLFPLDAGFSYFEVPGATAPNAKILNTSSLWIDHGPTLDGKSANNNWVSVNIGQDIPNLYNQYRLVSAAITVRYIGKMEEASGVIGGAIIFNDTFRIGGNVEIQEGSSTSTYDYPLLAKYGNFDLAMDSFFHQENLCIEGIRALYFPIDNSYEEFQKITDMSSIKIRDNPLSVTGSVTTTVHVPSLEVNPDCFKSGFNWFIYILGAPASSQCFKLDIFCNFECLVNAEYADYMPVTYNWNNTSKLNRNRSILKVKKKPILKFNEYI